MLSLEILIEKSFQLFNGPGVNSTSERNELLPSFADCLEILVDSTSRTHNGLSRPVME